MLKLKELTTRNNSYKNLLAECRDVYALKSDIENDKIIKFIYQEYEEKYVESKYTLLEYVCEYNKVEKNIYISGKYIESFVLEEE